MRRKVLVTTFCIVGRETWLLCLQTNEKRGQFWQNVTGSVEKNEALHLAAQREFQEETGIDLASENLSMQLLDLETSHTFADRKEREISEHLFAVIMQESELPKVQLDPKEHGDFKWIKLPQDEPPFRYPMCKKAVEITLGRLPKNGESV